MTTYLSLEQLKLAAIKSFQKWDRLYDNAIIKQNQAISDTKSIGAVLPPNYWQESYSARVRLEAAKELLEIIKEIEEENKNQNSKEPSNAQQSS